MDFGSATVLSGPELATLIQESSGPLFLASNFGSELKITTPLVFPDGQSITLTVPLIVSNSFIWPSDNGETFAWIDRHLKGRDPLKDDPVFQREANQIASANSVNLRGHLLNFAMPVTICQSEPVRLFYQLTRLAQASAEMARLSVIYRDMKHLD